MMTVPGSRKVGWTRGLRDWCRHGIMAAFMMMNEYPYSPLATTATDNKSQLHVRQSGIFRDMQLFLSITAVNTLVFVVVSSTICAHGGKGTGQARRLSFCCVAVCRGCRLRCWWRVASCLRGRDRRLAMSKPSRPPRTGYVRTGGWLADTRISRIAAPYCLCVRHAAGHVSWP